MVCESLLYHTKRTLSSAKWNPKAQPEFRSNQWMTLILDLTPRPRHWICKKLAHDFKTLENHKHAIAANYIQTERDRLHAIHREYSFLSVYENKICRLVKALQ